MAFKAYLPVLLFQLSVPCSILVFDAVLEPQNFRDKKTWPVAEFILGYKGHMSEHHTINEQKCFVQVN